jgi:hypothetical protein
LLDPGVCDRNARLDDRFIFIKPDVMHRGGARVAVAVIVIKADDLL